MPFGCTPDVGVDGVDLRRPVGTLVGIERVSLHAVASSTSTTAPIAAGERSSLPHLPGGAWSRLERAHDGGVALAAAAAEGGGTEPAAAAPQLVDRA